MNCPCTQVCLAFEHTNFNVMLKDIVHLSCILDGEGKKVQPKSPRPCGPKEAYQSSKAKITAFDGLIPQIRGLFGPAKE